MIGFIRTACTNALSDHGHDPYNHSGRILERAARLSRQQAGPIPGAATIPDSEDTTRRHLDLAQRAAFDMAVATAQDPHEKRNKWSESI